MLVIYTEVLYAMPGSFRLPRGTILEAGCCLTPQVHWPCLYHTTKIGRLTAEIPREAIVLDQDGALGLGVHAKSSEYGKRGCVGRRWTVRGGSRP